MGIDVCYSKGKFMITGSFTHTNPFDKPKNALHVSTVLTTSLPAALHLCCLFRRQCIVQTAHKYFTSDANYLLHNVPVNIHRYVTYHYERKHLPKLNQ